jgi:NAD+ synthase
LNIPEALINKPPSAGLWENQTDEKEMGFSYEILDKFLATGDIKDKRIEKNILKMSQLSEHKRKLPPTPNL